MNAVQLIGRLTKDPEIRTTQNGIKCGTFTLAVDRPRANKDGNREADFLPCVCWRGTAEFAEKWLTKGMKIAVLGSIQTRSYNAQDGTRRYVTEVVADSVEFLSPAQGAAAAPPPEAPSGQPCPPRQQRMQDLEGFTQVDDEELPF